MMTPYLTVLTSSTDASDWLLVTPDSNFELTSELNHLSAGEISSEELLIFGSEESVSSSGHSRSSSPLLGAPVFTPSITEENNNKGGDKSISNKEARRNSGFYKVRKAAKKSMIMHVGIPILFYVFDIMVQLLFCVVTFSISSFPNRLNLALAPSYYLQRILRADLAPAPFIAFNQLGRNAIYEWIAKYIAIVHFYSILEYELGKEFAGGKELRMEVKEFVKDAKFFAMEGARWVARSVLKGFKMVVGARIRIVKVGEGVMRGVEEVVEAVKGV